MDKKLYKKMALKKVVFSLIIIAIYLLGSSIPIVEESLYGSKVFPQIFEGNIIFGLTGISLSTVSIFSLGLAPWMSTMIIWRILSFSTLFKVRSLTQKQSFGVKIIISVFLGSIQSYGIVYRVNLLQSRMGGMLVITLVAGLLGLIILGEINKKFGLGGITLIIIVNIFRLWIHNANKFFSTVENNGDYFKIAMGVGGLIVLSLATLIFLKGEKRIPLMRVMLGDQHSAQSYFPIPNNPAGAMPLMYAFSLSILPQYIIFAINRLYGNNIIGHYFYEQLQLNQLFGIILLLITMMILTYSFSYINIDYKEISDNLKKNGDYFNNVYPGYNTERFLFHKITAMATKAVCFNLIILGFPMIISYFRKEVADIVYFIPTWFMVIVLGKEIIDEFKDIYFRNNYCIFISIPKLY